MSQLFWIIHKIGCIKCFKHLSESYTVNALNVIHNLQNCCIIGSFFLINSSCSSETRGIFILSILIGCSTCTFQTDLILCIWVLEETQRVPCFINIVWIDDKTSFYAHPGADYDVDAAAHHITAVFSACNGNVDKPVYHHFTTATDSACVQVVFHMVIDQIIKGNLAAFQLL